MDKEYVWNIILEEEFINDNQRIHRGGVWSFSTFEKAKENFFEALNKCFFNDSEFDGEDYMRQFEEYFDDPSYDDVEEEEDEDEREGFASMFFIGMDSSDKAGRKAKKIPSLIRKLIAEGEINPDPDTYCKYTDYLIGLGLEDGKITAFGVDDGPCNGIDPHILINFFKMDDPDREYNFRVGGGFNDKQTEKQTFFYLSVMKTEIDDPV